MTLIDLFKAFHNVAVKNNLSQAERVLYYTLLGEWNARKRPDKFKITRAEIEKLTGLSESAVRWSLEKLNQRKLIHTKGTPTGTNVQLNPIGTTNEQPTEKKANIRAREKPSECENQSTRARTEEKPILETDTAQQKLLEMYGTTNLAQIMQIRKSRLQGDSTNP